jgi:hypothetical protein
MALRGKTYRAAAAVAAGWALYTWGHARGWDAGRRWGRLEVPLERILRRHRGEPELPPWALQRHPESGYYGGDPVIAADQIDPSGRRGWWAARHRESRA